MSFAHEREVWCLLCISDLKENIEYYKTQSLLIIINKENIEYYKNSIVILIIINTQVAFLLRWLGKSRV